MKRAWLIIAVTTSIQCGAYDMDSRPVVEPPPCPSLDDHLSGLTAMVESGELSGLKSAVEDQILPGIKTRLVAVIVGLMDALGDGVLDDVGGLLDRIDGGAIETLGEVLESITMVGQPAYQAIGVAGTLMHDCTGQPLLKTLSSQLRSTALRADLDALQSSGDGVLGVVEDLGLDLSNPEGRLGFITFMRSLVAYISRPDFSVSELTGDGGILGAMSSDETPSLNSMIRVLNALLTPSSDRLAFQSVSVCLLDVDTDNLLIGLLFDVLHLQAIERNDVVEELSSIQSTSTLLDSLVLPLLDELVVNDSLRHSLVVVVAAMVHPDVVAKVLPDLSALINRGVLLDIIDLFSDVGAGICQETSS